MSVGGGASVVYVLDMTVERLSLPGLLLLTPKRHGDHRGFFAETYSRRGLHEAGVEHEFVQDNHSLSREKGVVRGLHYQVPPAAQAKLIRVIRGAILDVVVDIRRSSPTFGKAELIELSAENFRQLYVPIGFAHGFATLTPDTEVLYKVSGYYSPSHDRGILWNDPALGIDWGIDPAAAVLSEKDRKHPKLAEATELFE